LPLDLTQCIDHYHWCLQRNSQREKWINAKHIKHFMDSVHSISNSFTGKLNYYYNTGVGRYLSYGEGTPVFYFFKLSPEEYLIRDFSYKPYWLSHATSSDTIEYLLNVDYNKYKANTNLYAPDSPYILVVLNDMSNELLLIEHMCLWAKHNKHKVLFKAHPFPPDNSDPLEQWQYINNKSEYVELHVDINTNMLVDNCSALVTAESGVGMYALLKDKPVTYLRNDIDYSYGAIANYCSNLHDIDTVLFKKMPQQDIYQYLSWFYNKVIIDVSTDYTYTLYQRFDKYFNKKCNIDDYFTN